MDCNVIQDLLPLYADDACSEASREIVQEHLQECESCSRMLEKMKNEEIETDLKAERAGVIAYGEKRFRRRTATVGSTVSGVFMIPILAFLVINLISGTAMGWFFIVLASLAVAASLIIVPLTVPEDKAFWTFCAFTVSMVALLAVLVADAVLFLNMMNCIRLHNQQGTASFLLAAGCAAGITLLVLNRMKNGREKQ